MCNKDWLERTWSRLTEAVIFSTENEFSFLPVFKTDNLLSLTSMVSICKMESSHIVSSCPKRHEAVRSKNKLRLNRFVTIKSHGFIRDQKHGCANAQEDHLPSCAFKKEACNHYAFSPKAWMKHWWWQVFWLTSTPGYLPNSSESVVKNHLFITKITAAGTVPD